MSLGPSDRGGHYYQHPHFTGENGASELIVPESGAKTGGKQGPGHPLPDDLWPFLSSDAN